MICSCRTLSGAGSPCGPSPRPSLRFTSAEQVASLRSSAGCPNQRSGTESSLLRTPPTPGLARAASPFCEVAPPVESGLLAMTGLPAYPGRHFPTCHPRRPRRSIARPATVGLGRTLRPSPTIEKLGCREYFSRLIFVVHMNCDLPVRLHACSPPRLAATQLARSAVLNRLIAPAGLPPALTPASRAHR